MFIHLGGSAPSNPYTVDEDGRGPAWANSLFEDNAEHGLGMHLAAKKLHERLVTKVEALAESADGEAKAAIDAYLADRDVNEKTVEVSENLVEAVKKIDTSDADVKKLVDTIIDNKEYLNKRSTWILGGDGWAYDIGYGGLITSSLPVRMSTSSSLTLKYTLIQVVRLLRLLLQVLAEFAAGGKKLRKKDLGMMAMSYGYVYVAQISMGANQNQT